jgi:two-component system phosphate regulon sensor histidine kinase PhoR
MSKVWTSASVWLVLICLLALVVWPIVGPTWTLAIVVCALLLLLLTHLHSLASLLRWAQEPLGTPVPEATGVWGDVLLALTRRAKKSFAIREDLATTLERFHEAAQAMPDGVVILGKEMVIEWMNARAEQHLGLDGNKDVGVSVTNLVRNPEFVSYVLGGDYTEPLTMRSARNIGHTLALHVVGFGDDRRLLLSRDITQYQRLETMRRDFVANVSHELKTPLTVIIGFIETLIDNLPELAPRETEHFLSTTMDQAKRMQRLVEDLLVLSGLETESPPPDERIDVFALLSEVERDARALSAGRHLIHFDCEQGGYLLGSVKELRSALLNLASNAVRYTPAGGSIHLRWRRIADGAEISVEDTGIGIEAHHIPRLTERFYRVDGGRARDSGGTGLGLAIVKHVMTRHQGELRIESEQGKGSRFTARFPRSRVAAVAMPARS